ncbi:MAG: hypothetical protein V4717_20230 [Bacteroidota bacterium]
MKKYFSLFVTGLLFCCIPLLFTTCAKDYSYEGGPVIGTLPPPPPPSTPNAVFTLVGSPGPCNGARVYEAFVSGYKLTAGHYLEVNVDVVSIGKFIIKTDTINGFSFAASGEFTTTGIQPVLLAGTGIPVLSRNLIFNINGIASACNFPLTVLTPGLPAIYILESGNDQGCLESDIAGIYKNGVPLTSENKIKIKVFVTVAGVYTVATKTANGISFASTGEFPAQGSYFIDLVGSGTPTNSGTFEFQPEIVGATPIGGAACKIIILIR